MLARLTTLRLLCSTAAPKTDEDEEARRVRVRARVLMNFIIGKWEMNLKASDDQGRIGEVRESQG